MLKSLTNAVAAVARVAQPTQKATGSATKPFAASTRRSKTGAGNADGAIRLGKGVTTARGSSQKDTQRRQGQKWEKNVGPSVTKRTWAYEKNGSTSGPRKDILGFRVRARNLHLELKQLLAEMHAKRLSPAQRDQETARSLYVQAFHKFEYEMRALRVMIKDKSSVDDLDTGWMSASRLKTPYNTIIKMCLTMGKLEEAYKQLNCMKKDGIFPNATTYNVLVTETMRHHAERQSIKERSAESSPSEGSMKRWTPQKAASAYQIEDDSACYRRVTGLWTDLEGLWKEAFPQYFSRSPPQSLRQMALALSQPSLSLQERRNMYSKQASVVEARASPGPLTSALGAYMQFLGRSDQDIMPLFERMFPIPKQRDDSERFRALELLPLGNVSTFTIALRQAKGEEQVDAVVRTWQRYNEAEQKASNEPSSGRFQPDEHALTTLNSVLGTKAQAYKWGK